MRVEDMAEPARIGVAGLAGHALNLPVCGGEQGLGALHAPVGDVLAHSLADLRCEQVAEVVGMDIESAGDATHR